MAVDGPAGGAPAHHSTLSAAAEGWVWSWWRLLVPRAVEGGDVAQVAERLGSGRAMRVVVDVE